MLNQHNFFEHAAALIAKAVELTAKVLHVEHSTANGLLQTTGVMTLVCTVIAVRTAQIRRKFLPDVPGDLGLPWLGGSLAMVSGLSGFLDNGHKKHGDIFKCVILGEQHVCVRGQQLLEQTVGSSNTKQLEGAPLKSFGIVLEGAISSMNHEAHKEARRLYTKMMGPVPVKSYFNNISPVVVRRISEWMDLCKGEGSINIYALMQQSTVEANTAMFLGKGGISMEEIPEFHAQVVAMGDALVSLPFNIPGTAFAKGLKARDALRARIRKLAEAVPNDGSTLKDNSALAYFVNAMRSEHSSTFTMDNLLANMNILFFGAQDTMINGLTTAFTELVKRPDLVQAIRKEWNAVDGAPADLSVFINATSEEVMQKPITRAVFLESLRFRAPSVLTLRLVTQPLTLTTPEGKVIEVPVGTKIFTSLDSTMRSHPAVDQPNTFDPEWHFLNDKGGKQALDNPKTFAFCPFGGGYRLCPGKYLAEVVGVYWVAAVTVMCDLEVANPVVFTDGMGITPLNHEVLVRLKPRPIKKSL